MAESARNRQNRFSKPAKELLESFYKEHKYPSLSQKNALLQQLQQIPGCEDYTKLKVTTWFNTKRAKDAKHDRETKSTPVSEPQHISRTHAILYPSITVERLSQLNVLFDEHTQKYRTSPSPEMMAFWARVLRAEISHVKNWVDEKIALTKSSATTLSQSTSQAESPPGPPIEPSLFVDPPNQTRSLSQLPTPSQSTSPEPIAGPSRTIKPEPPLSPLIGRAPSPFNSKPDIPQHDINNGERVTQLPSGESAKTHLPSPVSPSFPEEPFPAFIRRSVMIHPNSQTNPVHILDPTTRPCSSSHSLGVKGKNTILPCPKYGPSIVSDLAMHLQNALSSQDRTALFPQNSSEFNSFFQPHEAKMRTLMERISNGSLQQVGWDPDLARDLHTIPPPPFTPKHC